MSRRQRRRRLVEAPGEPSGDALPCHQHDRVPSGLATRRQLRERRLRPGGQPVALITWRAQRTAARKGVPRGLQVAELYVVADALPLRSSQPPARKAATLRLIPGQPAPTARRPRASGPWARRAAS